jgi:GNAT superfamily N-acetyltransferase
VITVDPAGIQIREAFPADAEAIAAVHLDSIRSLGPRFYPPPSVDAWAAAVRPGMHLAAMAVGEVFFVAQDHHGHQLLGFSSYVPASDPRAPQGVSVYVSGSVSRRGVGSALLRAAEERARLHGATTIEIVASLAGVPFYRANGFVDREHVDVMFGGQTLECLTMRKAL